MIGLRFEGIVSSREASPSIQGISEKTLHQKMITVTYEKGNARVGCIRRNGCGGGSKETDQVFFCHFAPALYSPDKDFNKPAVDCQYDETFSNLCMDVPIRNSTTEAPVRIVYVKSSNGLQFIIVFAIILVARMI
uniref:SCP domain-containing protein n=1 Tax=Caenorhabditis tropicalis TaxID=1561998 RepID=A0A1I7THY4_9PELO